MCLPTSTSLPMANEPTLKEVAEEICDGLAAVPTEEWMAHPYDSVEKVLLRVVLAAKRSAHLEDAETAMEEGRRMLAARGRAAQRHRDNVVSHRESDAETCGRIADLIRAKAEVWDALSLPPGGQK